MKTQKFQPVQIALHWFIFLLVIVVYISALLRDNADEPLKYFGQAALQLRYRCRYTDDCPAGRQNKAPRTGYYSQTVTDDNRLIPSGAPDNLCDIYFVTGTRFQY